MTTWPARRSKDRILCGRQVDGRYVCTGEIAVVDVDLGPRLPPGFAIGPSIIGDERVRHFRTRRGAKGPGAGRMEGWDERAYYSSHFVPFTRYCPHCKVLAIVDDAVLK